jgi:hypothetical protein
MAREPWRPIPDLGIATKGVSLSWPARMRESGNGSVSGMFGGIYPGGHSNAWSVPGMWIRQVFATALRGMHGAAAGECNAIAARSVDEPRFRN